VISGQWQLVVELHSWSLMQPDDGDDDESDDAGDHDYNNDG